MDRDFDLQFKYLIHLCTYHNLLKQKIPKELKITINKMAEQKSQTGRKELLVYDARNFGFSHMRKNH